MRQSVPSRTPPPPSDLALHSQCPMAREELGELPKTEPAFPRMCRVCLETEMTHIDGGRQDVDPIVSLPCSCKTEMGMVHENCMKLWIKIWLVSKMNSIANGREQPAQGLPSTGNGLGPIQPQNRKVKSLNLANLKADTIYPFPCQICHCPVYFDLVFRRRLKKCSQITTKDLLLFSLPLLFTIAFLGICINWILQSGVNLYLILFYVLVGVPVLTITLAFGVWTFTAKQLWVSKLYSRSDLEPNLDQGNRKGGRQGKIEEQ